MLLYAVIGANVERNPAVVDVQQGIFDVSSC
jgi:hypothetical protein